MPKQPYLSTKNGTFYFRISAPTDLRSKIHKNELIYSLRTRCKYEAKARCLNMLRASQLLFKKFENMPRLKPEEAKEIVRTYFKEAIHCLEKQMDVVDEYSDALTSLPRANPTLDYTTDRDRLDFLYPNEFFDNDNDPALGLNDHYEPDLNRYVTYLKEKNGIEANNGSYSYNVLLKSAERAVNELLNVHRQYTDYDTEIKITDDLFSNQNINQNQTSTPNQIVEDTSLPFSKICHKYLAECKINGDGDHSIKAKQSCYDLWIEIFSDQTMNSLTPAQATKFKDIMISMPKNRKQKYPNKPITDVVKLSIPPDEKLQPNTVNEYLMRMSSLISWAIDNHHIQIDKNPFERLSIKRKAKAKSQEARQPFSNTQLQQIFNTPLYKGCVDETKHGRHAEGSMIIKDAYYWIPLIALYTGARMSEVIQMTASDIKTEDNVTFFDINEDSSDKSLKTTQSKRKIPIHSDLIKFGFIDYVENIKKLGEDRLFHQITPYNGDYSHKFSKWFSRFLDRFNIKTDKTSFHSFRHSFRDSLKTKTTETLVRALMGHEKGDTHNSYGSNSYNLKDLKTAIDTLDYNYIW